MLRRAALPLAILTGIALFATPADARTRITATGKTSDWSPVLTLSIS